MYHDLDTCGGNPPHRGAGRPKHKAKSVSYYLSFTTIPSSSYVFPSQNITITIYTTVTFPIIWVWNLVSQVRRKTEIEDIWEDGAGENTGPTREQ